MRVLLINKHTTRIKHPPLGLAYIAAQVEDEHEVKIIDLLPDQELSFSEIDKFNPDIIGFSLFATNAQWSYENIRRIKERSSIIVMAGGPHAAASPDNIIDEVDILVLSEGEYVVSALLKALENDEDLGQIKGIWYKRDEQVIKTPQLGFIENLDEVRFPARHLLNMKWYTKRSALIRGEWLKTTTIITSRGCPFSCIFCSTHITFGKKTRYRSAKNVVDEIELLVKEYGIEALWFCDDTFLLNKKHVVSVCDEIISRGIKIKWACQARVDQITAELCEKLRMAGCMQFDMGIESGSQKVLDALKKGTTVEKIIKASKLIRGAGLKIAANFVIGSPEETYEDVKKTEHLIETIQPDYSSFYILTPFPGTELYDMAEENGWMYRFDFSGGGYGTQFNNPVMNINFNNKELLSIRSRLSDYTLKFTARSYMFKFWLYWDIIQCVLLHPSVLLKAFSVYKKNKSISESIKSIVDSM